MSSASDVEITHRCAVDAVPGWVRAADRLVDALHRLVVDGSRWTYVRTGDGRAPADDPREFPMAPS